MRQHHRASTALRPAKDRASIAPSPPPAPRAAAAASRRRAAVQAPADRAGGAQHLIGRRRQSTAAPPAENAAWPPPTPAALRPRRSIEGMPLPPSAPAGDPALERARAAQFALPRPGRAADGQARASTAGVTWSLQPPASTRRTSAVGGAGPPTGAPVNGAPSFGRPSFAEPGRAGAAPGGKLRGDGDAAPKTGWRRRLAEVSGEVSDGSGGFSDGSLDNLDGAAFSKNLPGKGASSGRRRSKVEIDNEFEDYLQSGQMTSDMAEGILGSKPGHAVELGSMAAGFNNSPPRPPPRPAEDGYRAEDGDFGDNPLHGFDADLGVGRVGDRDDDTVANLTLRKLAQWNGGAIMKAEEPEDEEAASKKGVIDNFGQSISRVQGKLKAVQQQFNKASL